MATIEEDYVSFETAKLLKEKGFDEPCNCYGGYNGVNLTYRLCITNKFTNWNKHTDERIISCPTLQMTMKWLREVHNIHINIMYNDRYAHPYEFHIIKQHYASKSDMNRYNSHEETAEAAIKYCLENLI